ncbi:TIGR03088 family PEP-CTERM/XrtA system glycosyltransferase [Sediminicurvatus halobius]|uniref:TIGR03088 family PEP-CTERM/XrtA system glycosyltransferase n=1 Tax=Sediminicurvatus halobius TaxID=2182432 RepID=A0A2U2N0W3_9GAMM|nr:TIGR03088 family PEP-CTERM/XrtA system glycosyltransferase [Spiribacter halobius]PWG62683.1 TIGR03088 family PEP-CTERM/XrtA system glycosyltransferase [Spiribacter halobius]UEX77352.1 TIGR03088 family PEP-CTERM/XrtA system glycosyltransferase [Spiribacter halobius]
MQDDRPLIAHVVYRLDTGGLENGVVNLINASDPERFRHGVICLTGYTDFRARIRRADVPVAALDKRAGKDPAHYLRLARVLRSWRPAIVHTRNLGTLDAQLVAALSGVRGRVHGEHGWESGADATNPRSRRLRRALRPLVHRYIALSKEIERYLRTAVGVPPSRIRRICNGVDTERFRPAGAEAVASRERFTIGTVGRLVPVKDQVTLLRAFARTLATTGGVAEDGRPLELVLVGEGPLREGLETKAAELGITHACRFLGSRSDLPALYREMDLFVLPSVAEGISNTILEAMASGLPVAASNVGGNPELVEDNVNGTLVRAGSDTALAGVLTAYARDARRRRAHAEGGRRRALERFSLGGMARQYEEAYAELLEARGLRAAAAPAAGGTAVKE